MGLNFNFDFKYDPVNLDQLYTDAVGGNDQVNITSSQTGSSGVNVNSATNPGVSGSGGVETVDLSSNIQPGSSNGINAANGTTVNTQNLPNATNNNALNAGTNVNTTTTGGVNQTSGFSSSTDGGINAPTAPNNSASAASPSTTNLNTSSGINSTGMNGANSNGVSSNNISNNSTNMDFNTNNSSVNLNNSNNINMSNNTNTGSMGLNNSNGMNMNQGNNSDVNQNGMNSIGMNLNSGGQDNIQQAPQDTPVIIMTTAGENESEVKVELTETEYRDMLKSYGLTNADINRILNGEISAEALFKEIEFDADGTRQRARLETAYIKVYGFDFVTMDELNSASKDLTNELKALRAERTAADNRELDHFVRIVSEARVYGDIDYYFNQMPIAWEYLDEDGNICYLYEDPYMYGPYDHETGYIQKSYNDLYGDSELKKEFMGLLSEITVKPWFSDPYTILGWDFNEEQENYFFDLMNRQAATYETRQQELDSIDAKIAELEQQKAMYDYLYAIINDELDHYFNYVRPYEIKDDFAANSSFNKSSLELINKYQEDYGKSYVYSDTGITYVFINGTENIVDMLSCIINGEGDVSSGYLLTGYNLLQFQSSDSIFNHYLKWASLMNETEIEVFNYIKNTQGADAAYQYLSDISTELDSRWLAKKIKEDQEFAKEHPVLASILSIIVTPIEGIAAACYSLNSLIMKEEIRRVDVYSSGTIWRAQVSQDIAENYGDGWAFVYDTGMSMADTTLLIGALVLTGGSGTVVLSASLMGSRAYVSTLNDALDRGLSDGAACLLAASSAMVETAMESFSVGHFMKLEKHLSVGTANLISRMANSISNPALANFATKAMYVSANALSQGIVEGQEELCTEILNHVADRFIAGDLSNHDLAISNYLSLGYSEEEARDLANATFATQLREAFVGGFASGVCFGAFGGTRTTYTVSKHISENIIADFNGTSAQAFAEQIQLNLQLTEQQAELERMELNQKIQNYLMKINNTLAAAEEVAFTSYKLNVGNSLIGLGSSALNIHKRFFYKPLLSNQEMTNKVLTEGLYHFTSDASADAIINSGYLKNSGVITSYGPKKSFMFGGLPTVGDAALNINGNISKMTAVKFNMNEEVLPILSYRYMDDNAVTTRGNFNFSEYGLHAEKAYLCLVREGGKLVYKEVSKEEYDNYTPMNSSIWFFAKAMEGQAALITRNINDFVGKTIKLLSNSINNQVSDSSKLNIPQPQGNKTEINADEIIYASNGKSDFTLTDIDMGEFVELVQKVRNVTEETLPEGYKNIIEFKQKFAKTLIASGLLSSMDNNYMFELTQDSVIFSELIDTGYLNSLFIKNLPNTSVSALLIPPLSNLSTTDFNRFFDSAEMQDYVNSLSGKSLANILKLFQPPSNIRWVDNAVITNKISNMEISEFYEFVGTTGNYASNIRTYLESGNISDSFTNLLEIISTKFYTKEVLRANPQYKDKLRNLIPESLGNNDNNIDNRILNLIKQNAETKSDFTLDVLNSILSSSKAAIELTGDGALIYKGDSNYSRYTLLYEIDGIEYKETLINPPSDSKINLRPLADNVEITKAAMEGKLKIESLYADVKMSALVLDESSGIQTGLNEIILDVDGIEQRIVKKSTLGEINLNGDYEKATNAVVKSINPLGSFNVEVENVAGIYKIQYEIYGVDGEFFITPTKSVAAEEKGSLFIDNYIENNNLFGIANVQISEVSLHQLGKHMPNINEYKSSPNIYKSEKFGGNQNDVTILIEQKMAGTLLSNVEAMKAELLNKLIDKYLPSATEMQRINLATHYAHSGCSYMAVANAFATYMGDLENGSEIFKDKFGYDLFLSDGTNISYNVEAIAFDMYLRYFAAESNGNIDSIIKTNETGLLDIANTNSAGINQSVFDSIITNYFEEHQIGINCSPHPVKPQIDNDLAVSIMNNKNGFNILSAAEFDLELIDTTAKIDSSLDQALVNAKTEGAIIKDVGGHSMLITGVDENMNLLVSSWSEQYRFLSESVAKNQEGGKDARAKIWSIKFSIPTVVQEVGNPINVSNNQDLSDNITYNSNFNGRHDSMMNSDLTQNQISIINNVNQRISRGETVKLSYKNTSGISSLMLSRISDLSKVEFVVIDGLGDANGNLKNKYNQPNYYERITYSGFEMKSIISKIENIQSRIDMNLPVIERARQIYDILATEIPVMRGYKNDELATKVAQSLRGITDANIVGRQGLICAGYSSIFKEICDRVGITADYIRGDAIFDPLTGRGSKHAWNVVITKEGVIPIDVTWKACTGEEWFGPSDVFTQTHIADSAEEYYRVFNNPLNAIGQPMISRGNSIVENIKSVMLIHEQKYPGQGIMALKEVINNTRNIDNPFGYITSFGNARAMLQNIPMSAIRNYVNLYDAIEFAIKNHDAKYGSGFGLMALRAFISENGNFLKITGANGARQGLKQFSVTDIKQIFDVEFSNRTQYISNSTYRADGSEASFFDFFKKKKVQDNIEIEPIAKTQTNVFDVNNPKYAAAQAFFSKQDSHFGAIFDNRIASDLNVNLTIIESLKSNLILQENGTYKVYPNERQAEEQKNIELINEIDSLTRRYMSSNNPSETLDSIVTSRIEQLKNIIKDMKTELNRAELMPYYGSPEFLLERINYINKCMQDMINSPYVKDEVKQKVRNNLVEVDLNISNIQNIVTQGSISQADYDIIEKSYLNVKQIEDNLSGEIEQIWKSFLTDPKDYQEGKRFAYLAHVLTGEHVSPDKMRKICLTLITSETLTLPYGNIGYIYPMDMEHIVAMCNVDAGSWTATKRDIIDRYAPNSWQFAEEGGKSDSKVWFEEAKISKLILPDVMEKETIENNIRLNRAKLNYDNGIPYNEIYAQNKDNTFNPIGVFNYQNTNSISEGNIADAIKLAEHLNIKPITINLERLRSLLMINE